MSKADISTWAADTLPSQRVPQKILKKSISLYYISCHGPAATKKKTTFVGKKIKMGARGGKIREGEDSDDENDW